MRGEIKAAIALLVLWCPGLPAVAAEAPPPGCPASEPVKLFALPHLHAAIAGRQELLVVALGSSSTRGTGASDPAHSYPAVLQDALAAALPAQHVAVLNRGIGGQDAGRELARLDADAVEPRPQLVIWQAGANAALRGDDPTMFRRLIADGVRRLIAAGIDVILMDNQRSPRLLATSRSEAMDRALADTADLTNVGLFSRDRLMSDWVKAGEPADGFVAPDHLHLNDRGYRCIAQALARDILASLRVTARVARR